ncbi:enoyl-CoA hydratase [Bordetella pertussis]|nr:enoyl-CoA hydratase [Bordetella pertussis]
MLATPAARFCLSFMRIGLVPDFAAAFTLPRLVGLQRAR